METKIAMAGLAHGHGIGFLGSALKLDGVSVTGFYDNENKESTEEASIKFNAPVYDNLNELIYNSGANTLLTAAINSDKADIIVKAIDAGLNIISDKPLVTTMEDLNRIIDALKRNNGVKLFLMLSERYNPVLVTAKKLIAAGEIGDVVNIINMRPHRLKPESRPAWMFDSKLYGGIINDLGVHDIDIAAWLGDSDVDEVLAASVSNKRFTEISDFNDNGQAMLKLKNGCIVFIMGSWLTPDQYPHHGEMKFIIHGTHGQIVADPQNGSVILYSDSKKQHKVKIVKSAENYVSDAVKYFSLKDHKASVTTEDGIKAQKAALECQMMADGKQ
jgi:predicted dehydrogenase